MQARKVASAILHTKPFENLTVGAILGGLLVASLVVLGILYGLTVPHRTRARAFLRDLRALKVGESTLDQAQHLARQYGGISWYVDGDDMRCTFQRCDLAFQFDNKPLSYIPHLGYTRLFVDIAVKDGAVVGLELDYEHVSKRDLGFSYLVSENVPNPVIKAVSRLPYGVNRLKVDPSGVPRVLRVRLLSTSSEELKRAAYSLDLACLARLYGCTRASGFYPSALHYENSKGLSENGP
jgi:hypothetical protein